MFLETQNIIKTYGSHNAVDDVCLHIKKGDIYGLIGKNGAGKTTLMRLLVGNAKPTSGSVNYPRRESVRVKCTPCQGQF